MYAIDTNNTIMELGGGMYNFVRSLTDRSLIKNLYKGFDTGDGRVCSYYTGHLLTCLLWLEVVDID